MADPLDRIREQNRLNENRDIAQAERNMNWSNTFSNVPPADVLRDRVNYADTIQRATQNRLNLAAQSDKKALGLLRDTAEFEEWQKHAPLREQLLRNEVESKGAVSRFQAQKDSETQQELSGFFNAVSKISSKPGTPEYQQGLNAALQSFPRVIGTQVGADALKRLQQEHVDIAGIRPPAGQRFARTEFDESGKAKAVFEPIPVEVPRPSGVVPVRVTEGPNGTTTVFEPQEAAKSDAGLKSFERERGMHQSSYDRASQRRIQAQKALDGALQSKNQTLIDLNKDLVKAADADIIEAKKGLTETEAQINSLRAPASQVSPPTPFEQRPVGISSDGKYRLLSVKPEDVAKNVNPGEEYEDYETGERRKRPTAGELERANPNQVASSTTPIPEPEGRVILNRQTGQRMVKRDGKWQPL